MKRVVRRAVWAGLSAVLLGMSVRGQETGQPASKDVTIIQETPATTAKTDATPESPIPGLLKAADQASRNRDYSTCAQMLEKVVAVDPTYKNAWNYLGWTYNALGQYTKAESALRKAIEVDPKDPRAYNNRGQALAAQKKYPEAIAEYQKQA